MGMSQAVGWAAVFEDKRGDKAFPERHQVVVWQEDDRGHVVGLIATEDKHGLRAAESYSNFLFYEQDDTANQPVSAEHGWWVEWLQEDGSPPYYEPVLFWMVDSSGYELRAITCPDKDGQHEVVEADETTRFVYDPARRPYPG